MVNISPDIDTLNYSYKTKSYAILGATNLRWWLNQNSFITSYAAAGIAWNKLGDYNEAVPAGSSMSSTMKPFLNYTTRQPAFSLGIAIGYQIKASWAVELGYRYLNTGKAYLKAPEDSLTQPNFTAGTLSAQMLYLNLLFP